MKFSLAVLLDEFLHAESVAKENGNVDEVDNPAQHPPTVHVIFPEDVIGADPAFAVASRVIVLAPELTAVTLAMYEVAMLVESVLTDAK